MPVKDKREQINRAREGIGMDGIGIRRIFTPPPSPHPPTQTHTHTSLFDTREVEASNKTYVYLCHKNYIVQGERRDSKVLSKSILSGFKYRRIRQGGG